VFPAISTIASSGVVTGVSSGIDTIRYTAVNGCGTTITRKVISVTAARGIVENSGITSSEGTSIQLYPNPSTGKVTLKINGKEGTSTALLLDMTGKLITTKATDEETMTFDMSDLPRGIYIFKVSTGGKEFSAKVVVE
jgi:hypothetical protein